MNRPGNLFTVSAPSGAGKTSLVRALVEGETNLTVSVSHTTRKQRPGEQDGINYHFIQTDVFKQMVADQAFFEWAEVFGNLYGTAQSHVQALLDDGTDVILEIDWQGAQQVKARVPGACAIFILPPSLESLQERLTGRGQDDPNIIAGRMAAAKSEMAHWHEADFVVMNDVFDTALADLRAIVRSQRLRKAVQAEALAATLSTLSGD